MTLLSERPLIWVDIDIPGFTDSYTFDGTLNGEKNEDYIYLDVNSRKMIFSTDAFGETVEISLFKIDQNSPFLKIFTKQDNSKGSFESLVPVIVLPPEQWSAINKPKHIAYEAQTTFPRLYILRKYIDIYKFAKNIRIYCNNHSLILEAGNDIQSQVMTTFKSRKVTDENGEPMHGKVIVIVDGKKLSLFYHSINLLNLPRPKITGRINSQKHLKIDFMNDDQTISYNALFEHVEDEDFDVDVNANVFEMYREELRNFDAEQDKDQVLSL